MPSRGTAEEIRRPHLSSALKWNQAVEKICEHPASFPPYLYGTQKCLLKKFPYLVVFREYRDHLFLVAVAHGRREPGYWRKRVR